MTQSVDKDSRGAEIERLQREWLQQAMDKPRPEEEYYHLGIKGGIRGFLKALMAAKKSEQRRGV